jgi:hypothetical protein
VLAVRGIGVARSLNLGLQGIHHVAHALIIGDRMSRPQVIQAPILTRTTASHDRVAPLLSMM